uniref:Retrotransposon gag domain-containing protein n=1 Tax=Cajanus cajan TaxID=3821 RepID=A0A151T8P0_CAJCA|nr:hypothetical protein KK1_017981 [Cajanus cajan]
MTISEYFTRLKTYWEELEMFEPLPQCSCINPCDCVLLLMPEPIEPHVIRFLRGLNEHYSQV